jgi:hypothetical protein
VLLGVITPNVAGERGRVLLRSGVTESALQWRLLRLLQLCVITFLI